MKKKYLALILAAAMACSLTACGSNTTSSSAAGTEAATEAAEGETAAAEGETEAAVSDGTTTKDELIIAMSSDVTTFDPHIDTNGAEVLVGHSIYQTLWLNEDSGDVRPVLATEWEWEDDLHLNVTLREGVTFSNGNAFTSSDVIYTINHGLEGAFPQYYSKLDMDATTCPDDYHINFVFSEVDPTFMYYMGGDSTGAILDEETVTADPDNLATSPVGTGPYVLANWTAGDSLTLTPNETYWGDAPIIKTVTFRVITDATQRANSLKAGEVDFAYGISSLDADSFASDANYVTKDIVSAVQTCLFINNDEGHKMSDENVRKAFKSCIDKESLASVGTSGTGQAAWTPVLYSQTGFNQDYYENDPYPQDFEACKQYLAEAGYADGLTLKIVYQDGDAWNNVYEALQNWCAQGGITLEAEKGDFATALSTALDRTGDWDIFILANGSSSPLITMSWFDETIGAPFAQFNDADFYSLLAGAYSTTDVDEQNKILEEAQAYLMEHVGVVPCYTGVSNNIYVSNLQGVNFFDEQGGEQDLEYLYFN